MEFGVNLKSYLHWFKLQASACGEKNIYIWPWLLGNQILNQEFDGLYGLEIS